MRPARAATLIAAHQSKRSRGDPSALGTCPLSAHASTAVVVYDHSGSVTFRRGAHRVEEKATAFEVLRHPNARSRRVVGGRRRRHDIRGCQASLLRRRRASVGGLRPLDGEPVSTAVAACWCRPRRADGGMVGQSPRARPPPIGRGPVVAPSDDEVRSFTLESEPGRIDGGGGLTAPVALARGLGRLPPQPTGAESSQARAVDAPSPKSQGCTRNTAVVITVSEFSST